MADKTLFQKIADREIPAEIVYEDDLCLCFRDINPQAPVHLLLVPRKPVPRIAEATPEDQELLGHLFSRVRLIAEQEGFATAGFRTVVNNGPHGGEEVPHLHIHLLAGRQMTWPPG
ncbi:MAG: histidine triad nucleotide-binding protein [Akkermansiaceae bacterium]|nr:histidine triad nucleotide-binding protein [Akkermansiaceae bacterium]NNM28365.1 histidine triad nucleotide-binding protein [Akkermansiaceae bacterium]